MQAMNEDYTAFVDFAQRLGDVAGDILRQHFRMPVSVERKADQSPVTLADRAVEDALRRLIEKEYPEHGIIGEEFGDVRDHAPFQWVLDPIDGTRSFLGGYPIFTSLIALVHEQVPVLGLITQPIARERWLGVRSGTTTLNDKPAIVRGCKQLADAVVATTSIDYFTPAQTEKFRSLRQSCAHTVLGGDAYAYAMLASGQMDVVVDAGMKAYDFCALAPVVAGAGGVITDWNGKALTSGSDGRVVAAVNAKLHAEALALLQ